ncbi:general substrate transporter [Lineolata rhizophorae]|uniref:General substrate transporter n=1 Tax=Lineolata rhizophorae TaxID=578093 RepID=A0A6A6NL52_9PEZI|nr:general substrate transporter [Lineolata rhizophorae]
MAASPPRPAWWPVQPCFLSSIPPGRVLERACARYFPILDSKAPRGASSFGAVFREMTPALFVSCFITALLNMLFGFDTTSFAGVQSIPAFGRQFGTPIGPNGAYQLSASRASFMSSIGFAGKFVGTLTAPLLIERIGHRLTIWVLCTITFVGVTVECTSHAVVQFVLGRVVVYYSVGLAENTSTTYQSEIVPASMRGAIVGSIQLFIQFGQIFSSGINQRFSTGTQSKDWIIPVAVQAAVPVIIVFGTIFIPSGPRWLIGKGRKDDAIRTLERVRPRGDTDAGHCQAEADAIQEAMEGKTEKGPWLDLFRGSNFRRTSVATVVFIFQQFTGQGFVSQYSPRFYKTIGLGEHAFEYNIASSTVAWAGVFIGMLLVDSLGRRNLLIWGAIFQAIFLFSMAGVGIKKNPSASDARGLVACVMLFNFFFCGTWAPIAYVIGSEIGTGSLREKTMAFASTINVVAAWLVAFCVPYLIDAIGANIGWLFGGFSVLATLYAYFCVPEIMNRSLEELDELFENHVPAPRFASTQTHGAARRIAELENQRCWGQTQRPGPGA